MLLLLGGAGVGGGLLGLVVVAAIVVGVAVPTAKIHGHGHTSFCAFQPVRGLEARDVETVAFIRESGYRALELLVHEEDVVPRSRLAEGAGRLVGEECSCGRCDFGLVATGLEVGLEVVELDVGGIGGVDHED